jgi:hypothetical protein
LVNESASVVYDRVTDVRSQWTDDRRFIERRLDRNPERDEGGLCDRLLHRARRAVGRYVNVIPGAPFYDRRPRSIS